jgi:hypothetical protein
MESNHERAAFEILPIDPELLLDLLLREGDQDGAFMILRCPQTR